MAVEAEAFAVWIENFRDWNDFHTDIVISREQLYVTVQSCKELDELLKTARLVHISGSIQSLTRSMASITQEMSSLKQVSAANGILDGGVVGLVLVAGAVLARAFPKSPRRSTDVSE